ncbi:YrrS family protein [Bacillus spizizenii]|nr:YrrS family protein [Bacillus spizizenii]MCY8110390.1 YrrS family protein [Bacillus spizizenii]MCY8305491.1 YrrS family protein [Bacillus spizizenii]MCY8660285.1 YrrS family protein [Bacillus spizizenii]MCY8687899.1 YrrS family protein [Bacillus spizizenii]
MSNNQSRYENRDKRRKANLVLNILIAIVSILIVVVAANLFINSPSSKDVSKDSETAQKQESPALGKTEKKSDEDIKDSKKDTSDSEKDSEKSSDSDSKKDDSSSKSDDSDSDSSSDSDDPLKDAKVTEGGSSSDVEKTYENPDWKAVGTEQTGEHAATYDSSSQDWAEMLKAISYATGVSTDHMTVLWLGNNGSPQDAKGKILDKTTGDKYQVTITWVDEKGWKPTKVEKLK